MTYSRAGTVLRERRAKVWEEAAAIAGSSLPLTTAQIAKWEQLNAQLQELDSRIKAVMASTAKAVQQLTRLTGGAMAGTSQPGPGAHGFSENGEFDFTVGSLHGLRMWDLGEKGSLTGNFGHTWEPGENLAVCPKTDEMNHLILIAGTQHAFASFCREAGIQRDDERVRHVVSAEAALGFPPDSRWIEIKDGYVPLPGIRRLRDVLHRTYRQADCHAVRNHLRHPELVHDVPGPNSQCGCGFWAYWTPDQARSVFNPSRPVLGVIEGYGKTRVGDRGFRCSKARILAVCLMFDWPALTYGDQAHMKSMCEAEIEDRYPGVKIYCKPEAMLVMHPPTPDYLPAPPPPPKPALPKFECPAGIGLDTIDIRRDVTPVAALNNPAMITSARAGMQITAWHDDGSQCDHAQQAIDAGQAPFTLFGAGQSRNVSFSVVAGSSNVVSGGGGGSSGLVWAPAAGGGGGSGHWVAQSSQQQLSKAISYALKHHPNGQPRATGASSSFHSSP